jgi:hypothetical protein
MQDLFENYVSELNKLREAFHNELAATSNELSKAMDMYARRGEAALASFMEKRRGSMSFAVFQHAAVFRTLITVRSWIPQQMRIELESHLLPSGRSPRACMSRAMEIASRSWAAR